MKINWNKIIAGALITSSITREASSMNFNYNPNLEKTFEVAEAQSQNFAEINLFNQELTDIYSVREPIKCPAADCAEKLFMQLGICTSLSFPPAVAICVAAAWAAYGICMS